jgi:AraC-like DNA-binding protein
MPSGESAVRSAALDKLKLFIDERHFEFDLTPGVIAAANGLSRRYVHRLFQESGQSVGEFIRSRRLMAARRTLENPLHLETPIADIGHSHGFRSAAHFSSAYCGEFGETPRATRARLRERSMATQARRRLS